jgi:cytochrome c oxidase subunit 1
MVFIGLNATFMPQFIMGTRGMPRRYYNYLPEFQPFHVASTIGAYILGAGFLLTAGYLLWTFRKKMDAPMNPWGAGTLEWTVSSPPPYYNFKQTPVVTKGPYEMDDLFYDEKIGGYVRKGEPAA